LPSTFSIINSSSIIATPTITTTYTVIGANGLLPNLCSSTKTIQIVVHPKIIPVVSPIETICVGKTTTIFATGGNTYNWAPSIGVYFPNDSTTIVKPTTTTIYTVTVSKNGICPVTNTTQVTVMPLPIVDAGRDTIINIDENIVLNGTGNVVVGFLSPDNNPLICNWCPIVTVYPQKTTCYTLEGFNSLGCRNTDEVCITVTKNCDVFIPNSFTPNGDIDNEYFMPKGYGFNQLDLIIYDKWGKIIFNENNTILGWDGKNNGVKCPQDIYVYQVTVHAISGKEIFRTGHLTLLTATR
jgi:gliding motility-associated-like protein